MATNQNVWMENGNVFPGQIVAEQSDGNRLVIERCLGLGWAILETWIDVLLSTEFTIHLQKINNPEYCFVGFLYAVSGIK
jgi:hypothetical protein